MANALANRHILAALLDARGATNDEIAETLSITTAHLSANIKSKPEYRMWVEKFRSELAEKTLDRAAELLSAFDNEALPAFKTLQQIHKNAQEKGSTRIAAALGILERSSLAPRRRSDDASAAATRVFIGKVAMERIRQACDDLGDAETLTLVGDDYESELKAAIPDGEITPQEAP